MRRTPYFSRTMRGVRLWRRVRANQSGSTATEYALIAAGVGAAIAATVYTLGDTVLNNLYETIVAAFE